MTPGAPVATAIPFHRPSLGAAERAAVLDVLESGWLTTGERSFAFEAAVSARTGSRHAVAVNSATAALHLALEAVGVGAGDEVIVPTYTFAACGEVVCYLGATPRLADVDATSLAVTPATIEPLIGPRTRALIVVHFGGATTDMSDILGLAERHRLAVIEDAAHALPATRGGRQAGTFGTAGALSFYATKTVTTGEGGMLLTADERIADRARLMRLHGISRDAWKRYTSEGSWYYEIEDVGFKYNLTDLAAAIGLVQLERADEMRMQRQRVAGRYGHVLAPLVDRGLVELPPAVSPGDVHAWHLYAIRLGSGGAPARAAVIDQLRDRGIGTSVHFIPLHLHPFYRRTFGYQPSDLPVATHEYEREISLPIYPDLSDDDVDRVGAALAEVLDLAR